MAIIKVRTAKLREYDCGICGKKIEVGMKYYDTNESANPPKPFPKKKICIPCGDNLKSN